MTAINSNSVGPGLPPLKPTRSNGDGFNAAKVDRRGSNGQGFNAVPVRQPQSNARGAQAVRGVNDTVAPNQVVAPTGANIVKSNSSADASPVRGQTNGFHKGSNEIGERVNTTA